MERPTVVIEIGDDTKLARDISAGGVFVPGCKLALNSECALVVRGPEEEIELPARVVYVDPRTGAGLELSRFTPALRDHLTRIFTAWTTPGVPARREPLDLGFDPAAVERPAPEPDVRSQPPEPDDPPAQRSQAPEPDDDARSGAPEPDDDALADLLAGALERDDDDQDAQGDPEPRKKALAIHERLRGLTLAQQIKAANSPDPQERIMLERFYGKNVWEPLLRNSRLTPPEVARIARMGTLPRTLLEIIVANGAWLQMPEVRRALLSNPRLGTDQILKILRLLPKHELKMTSTGTAYPHAVRDCAKRILKEQGNS